MERHRCKLCSRSFANGRALGGHMRSHMMSLPLRPKPEESPSTHSTSSPCAEEEGEGEGEGERSPIHGLRENLESAIRISDPEFAFSVDAGSVVLQDRESETESSKYPTRRRSRRIVRNSVTWEEEDRGVVKKLRTSIHPRWKAESFTEPEPESSVSDATTEEDVALWLMMLSRDKWKRQIDRVKEDSDEEEEVEEENDDEEERSSKYSEKSRDPKPTRKRVLGKYKCEACDKVFRSYQALGGHKANHKNMKRCARVQKPELEKEAAGASVSMPEKKIHECPVCFSIFSSGQALGGHKRIHPMGTSRISVPARNSTKFRDGSIDLNLPAPVEDEVSQIEFTAVSGTRFRTPSGNEMGKRKRMVF